MSVVLPPALPTHVSFPCSGCKHADIVLKVPDSFYVVDIVVVRNKGSIVSLGRCYSPMYGVVWKCPHCQYENECRNPQITAIFAPTLQQSSWCTIV